MPRSPVPATIVLVWAFRVFAQFGPGPAEQGWVATATAEACDAAQRAFIDLARLHDTTVNLGDCREVTPDDLRRPPSSSTDPNGVSAADYYGVPRTIPSRGPRSDPQ